jgi:hypothetical protein
MHDIFAMSTEKSICSCDLPLEATHREQRCLKIERRVEQGWVIEGKCVEWQMLELPWEGRIKFTLALQ